MLTRFKIYPYIVQKNSITPCILANGEIVLFYNGEEFKPWKLEKNEDICIEIFTDISHYQSSGNLRVGYVLEDVYYDLGNVTVTEHENLTFIVPEAGDYYFYILCSS